MSEPKLAYDEAVADGIRSGNPGLHELSKQIADLRSKLEAAKGEAERISAANDVPEMYGAGKRYAAERILAALLEPANAEGIASEGGPASVANPRDRHADAPSAEAGQPTAEEAEGGRWTGRQLYHRWCGSSESDKARYFDAMNPAERRAWERLARELPVGEAGQPTTEGERVSDPSEGRRVSVNAEARDVLREVAAKIEHEAVADD